MLDPQKGTPEYEAARQAEIADTAATFLKKLRQGSATQVPTPPLAQPKELELVPIPVPTPPPPISQPAAPVSASAAAVSADDGGAERRRLDRQAREERDAARNNQAPAAQAPEPVVPPIIPPDPPADEGSEGHGGNGGAHDAEQTSFWRTLSGKLVMVTLVFCSIGTAIIVLALWALKDQAAEDVAVRRPALPAEQAVMAPRTAYQTLPPVPVARAPEAAMPAPVMVQQPQQVQIFGEPPVPREEWVRISNGCDSSHACLLKEANRYQAGKRITIPPNGWGRIGAVEGGMQVIQTGQVWVAIQQDCNYPSEPYEKPVLRGPGWEQNLRHGCASINVPANYPSPGITFVFPNN